MQVSPKKNDQIFLDQSYDTLTNSYNTLRIILDPNLSDEKKNLLNFILETLTSQLKLFMDLITTTSFEKIYQILNLNNQQLSKRISYLFSLFEKNNYYNSNPTRNLYNSIIIKERDRFENLKIQSLNNFESNSVSNETIIKNNNAIYDKDEENNITNNENNENLGYKDINNNKLIKINQKKFETKIKCNNNNNTDNNINSLNNSNNKNININSFKKFKTNMDNKNNIISNLNKLGESKDKKDMSYNLNINIYSNRTNNNSLNSMNQKYNNCCNLNSNNYYTNTNIIVKNTSNNKQKNKSKKNYNNLIKKKYNIGMQMKIYENENNINNNEKKLNNRINKRHYKTKCSPKISKIKSSSKEKINRNYSYHDKGLNKIYHYKIYDNCIDKKRSHSQTKYEVNKISLSKKIKYKFKTSNSCPKRNFVYYDNNKNVEFNINLSNPHLLDKNIVNV